ncbi:homeobox protein siamois-like [Discoglossus pictus]
MDNDTELDQAIFTSLSLQDDYPDISPPLRNQENSTHSSTLWSSPDLLPGIEIHLPLQKKGILQQTPLQIYSDLGIPKETTARSAIEKSPKEEIIVELHHPKSIKRSLSEEEQVECKKHKASDDSLATTSNNRCRKRTVFNREQTLFLQNQFHHNPYPDFVTRCRIAQLTNIPEPRIQVWFQNRRARHLPRLPRLQGLQRREASAEGLSLNVKCEGYPYMEQWPEAQVLPKTWLFPNGHSRTFHDQFYL